MNIEKNKNTHVENQVTYSTKTLISSRPITWNFVLEIFKAYKKWLIVLDGACHCVVYGLNSVS